MFRYRQQAADYIADRMADAGFRRRVDAYRQMIAADETKLSRGREEAAGLNRDWVLARLRRVHAIAMLNEPVGIAADGAEVYLKI